MGDQFHAATGSIKAIIVGIVLPTVEGWDDRVLYQSWPSIVLVGLAGLFMLRLREQWRPPREAATSSVERSRTRRRFHAPRLHLALPALPRPRLPRPAYPRGTTRLLAATMLLAASSTIVASAAPGHIGDGRLRGWSDLRWAIKYDGYGTVGADGETATLAPRAVTDPAHTSAAMVLAGDPQGDDYRFTVRMRLEQQLRQNSPPNTWETGWLIFRYERPGRAYYLAHKTNGVELGKLVPPVGIGQDFLATVATPPAEPGRWYDYRIEAVGPQIRVFIDDQLVIDYTDPDPILSGQVGLYCEDARVLFQHPQLTPLTAPSDTTTASATR